MATDSELTGARGGTAYEPSQQRHQQEPVNNRDQLGIGCWEGFRGDRSQWTLSILMLPSCNCALANARRHIPCLEFCGQDQQRLLPRLPLLLLQRSNQLVANSQGSGVRDCGFFSQVCLLLAQLSWTMCRTSYASVSTSTEQDTNSVCFLRLLW